MKCKDLNIIPCSWCEGPVEGFHMCWVETFIVWIEKRGPKISSVEFLKALAVDSRYLFGFSEGVAQTSHYKYYFTQALIYNNPSNKDLLNEVEKLMILS